MDRDPKAEARMEEARRAAAERSKALRAAGGTTPPPRRPGPPEQPQRPQTPAQRPQAPPQPQPTATQQRPAPATQAAPALATRQEMAAAREQLRDTTNVKLLAQQLQTTLAEFRPLVKQAGEISADLRSIVSELKEMLGPLGDPGKVERFASLLGTGVALPVALAEVLAPHAGSPPTEDTGERS